jgi:hypothetical protein
MSDQPGGDVPPSEDGGTPGQQRPAHPLGRATRKRTYFLMMGVCLLLVILSWTVIWHYSTIAAVVMSAVALVIPPFAAIVANAGDGDRQ